MNIKVVIKEKSVYFAPFFLILFIFFVPISPSLRSIFLVCSVMAVLLTPSYNRYLFYTFNTLWGRAALALFAFIVIACLWSQAPYAMQWEVVSKYLKLLYLPVLAVVFMHPRVRRWGIHAYLAAVFLTCIISFIKAKSNVPDSDPGEVFSNHIITGFTVSLGVYLAGILALQCKNGWRMVYLALAGVATYQIFFINTGRTAYLIYCILMLLLLLQKLALKKAILGALILSVFVVLAYEVSPVMQNGLNKLVNDVKAFQHHDENTSLGFRLQFHHYAKSLLATHPLGGIGTGGFKYRSSKDNPFPVWGNQLNDPHSQYWLVLSEQGIIGFLLLLFFLASLLIASFQLSQTRPILWGILASFSVIALSDTVLCYSVVGFILIIMSALSFGELLEKHALLEPRD